MKDQLSAKTPQPKIIEVHTRVFEGFDGSPQSSATTAAEPQISDLIMLAEPQNPTVWVRDSEGYVGIGETLRLEFFGVDRFSAAAEAWRLITIEAKVVDEVKLTGTGLMAFCSFTFADDSAAPSVLIVPQQIFGITNGVAWHTTLKVADDGSGTGTDTGTDTETAATTKKALGAPPQASFIEPAGEAAAYREGVHEASTLIAAGKVKKIVLARRLVADIDANADLRVPLTRLADTYTDCWTYAVDGMLGASPETLIRTVNGQVSARVLAGTRKRSLDPARDIAMRDELTDSTKEQLEHKFAVDSLRETLSPYVLGLEVDKNPFLLQLPNVWHLATHVKAKLNNQATALQLAGAVHPTAAVAGTPTPLAVGAISSLEPFDRGRYAGAVGWVNGAGDGDFAIALRCAQVGPAPGTSRTDSSRTDSSRTDSSRANSSRTVTAYAGGGIVAGSDPWHELTETVAKFRPIIEAFA